MRYYERLLGLVFPFLMACMPEHTLHTYSPDGHIHVCVMLQENGVPAYAIEVDDTMLVAPSVLGFTEKGGRNLSSGFQVLHADATYSDETWHQPWGENKTVRNHYRGLVVHLENQEQVHLTLHFRVFDDGVGFRYEYEVPRADSLLLTDERTEFRLARPGLSWSIPASAETYEMLYRTMPVDSLTTANTPLTFRCGGLYASLHEAALTDFPEMTLTALEGRCLKSTLASWPDGVKCRVEGGRFRSPWRTLQVARQAVGLVNSSLILNLNEPCVLRQTSWIKPMKYVGIWWGMHLGLEGWSMDDRHGATTEQMKRYIDFAARNNIQAVLAEGWNEGWEQWGGTQEFDYTRPYADFDLDEIARYAREKGVELIGHHETGGNVPNYERQLQQAYDWYAERGVRCVKTGYAGGFPNGHSHHGQYAVRHYRKVVEEAASRQMTLDVHEPIKDTGIRRTYPNMMTREGGRGMEWNAWSEGNPPEHHVMLPFTRLLAGPMDYTPGIFDILYDRVKNHPNRKQWNMKDSKDCRVNTTLAKQLACWVILYSPLQMAADLIENYEGHPAFQFFRDFNPDCDWSRALSGEPGEYVVVVRAAKDRLFLGAATNAEPRQVDVPLDFLPKGRAYRAVVYADAPETHWQTNPTAYEIRERMVSASDTLSVWMAAGGGQAVTFCPVD
ncbi:MAG: glycoside hydrolase family 97 protein [Bacteroidaceae bacterium]